jgi:protein TonB
MYDNLRNVLDFDDLLFESRNKDYGAYKLRKRYNSVLGFCIIAASLLVSSAIVLPFVINPESDEIHGRRVNYVHVNMQSFEPPVDQIHVPPAPPPPNPVKVQEIVKYVPPVVVDTLLPFETTLATPDQILSQTTTDALISGGTGTGDNLISGYDGMGSDEPFFLVEVMPAFRGGDINKFREWVQKRTNYPQIAIDQKIQGRVFLTFIVEPDGSVSNVTVVKGVDPIIDTEAVKAIEASPRWTPGFQRGQAVRVRYSMSLSFVF